MQRKNKCFYMLSVLSLTLVFLAGCGFQKEVVLEHSGHEWEIVTEKEASSDDEEVQVITGQITEDKSSWGNGNQGDKEGTDTTSNTTSVTDMIYVHICGQVQRPGVYQVPADARVFSVIQMAGGLTEEADAAGVNQAQALVDGQMIYIPAVGEELTASVKSAGGSLGQSQGDGKININTADLETLMSLPGIGEGKAQSILNYRQEHGSFQSIEEIMNVEGIKEGTFSKFKDQITI